MANNNQEKKQENMQIKKQEKKKTVLGKVIENMVFFACMAILLLAVIYGVQNYRDPDHAFLLGYKVQLIKSDSMAPELVVNSLIFVKDEPYDRVNTKDIIVYKTADGKYICHRVARMIEEGLITKGDNNRVEDDHAVTADNYIGKVTGSTNLLPEFLAFAAAPNFAGLLKYILMPGAIVVILAAAGYLWKNRGEGEEK